MLFTLSAVQGSGKLPCISFISFISSSNSYRKTQHTCVWLDPIE